MIKSFTHKGLEKFYEDGTTKGIVFEHSKKIRMRLVALDTAKIIEDMQLPGFGLYKLKGERSDIWSIKVNGNWRITFRFENGDVYIVNYEDYH